MRPEPKLVVLAEAVADGSSIDWERAEASANDPDDRDIIQQLRKLASVRPVHMPAQTWGPFEIRSEIGHGTFGTVYRAWDPRLTRDVALKLLRHDAQAPSPGSTVIKEAQLLARVRHSNIVTVHGAEMLDGCVGIWMEFISGRTLRDIVSEHGPFGAYEAAIVGRDLCRALAVVHREGLLHCDIKAQNVMREAGGRIVLMDFGAGEAELPDALAQHRLRGTPVYLAPELFNGGRPTVLSDIYSLGVLLYHLVSGRFPVIGSSPEEIGELHARGQRTRLRDVRPDLPAAFVRAIDAATSPNPLERPASAGAMEALLEHVLVHRDEHGEVAAEGIGNVRPSIETAAFGRPRLLVAALILMTAIGGFLVRWESVGSGSPAARNSVAILPFRNLMATGDESDILSAGLADDLVAHLASLQDLRVVAGASTRQYEDRQKTEKEIGAELGVAAVLDGSIRQSGNRVRIVGRLIDATTGEQLWSESFERDLEDVFVMQSEVARKIAVALKGELSAPDAERLGTPRQYDFEAVNLYLKGRYYWAQRTEDSINQSIRYFTDAIARDPAYAAAYAGLADAYTALGLYGVLSQTDAFTRAAEAATKAVALDDELAEGHASLAYVHKNRFEWDAAERSFKRAIELKPGLSSAHHWYSIFLTQHGRFSQALTEIKTAISLDPLSIGAQLQLASALMMARRYDDAIAQYERGLQMDPGFASAYRGIAKMYAFQGLHDRAAATIEKAARATPVGAEDQELKADRGFLFAVSGHRTEALNIIHELVERHDRSGEALSTSIASIYTGLGRADEAFTWLRRARDEHDPEISYLKVDPQWDALRKDPRFNRLLVDLGYSR